MGVGWYPHFFIEGKDDMTWLGRAGMARTMAIVALVVCICIKENSFPHSSIISRMKFHIVSPAGCGMTLFHTNNNDRYNSWPTGPIPVITTFRKNNQTCLAIMNSGTGGSFALDKCNCKSKETMLMKLAIENTLKDADVSFRIFIFRCVRW